MKTECVCVCVCVSYFNPPETFKDEDFQRSLNIRIQPNVNEDVKQVENEVDQNKQLREPLKAKINYNAVVPNSKKFSAVNEDLTRTEQLSGVYYLKDNYSLNTHEVLSRRRQQHQTSQITDDMRHKIIQRNDGILGLNKANIENQQQALLNKRKQIENHRVKHSYSDLSLKSQNKNTNNTSNDALLPPNFRDYLAKRNKVNESPFLARTLFAQDAKISNKFYVNSKPLLNASLLNGHVKTPNLKAKDDDESSESESSDSDDD
jgi:hypothetical protein